MASRSQVEAEAPHPGALARAFFDAHVHTFARQPGRGMASGGR